MKGMNQTDWRASFGRPGARRELEEGQTLALGRRKRWVLAILAVVLAGGGTAYYFAVKENKPSQAAGQEAQGIAVTRGDIHVTITGTSQFQAQNMQDITAPADGTIKMMNLTRSKAVKQGDVLLVSSDVDLEANLKDAEARLATLKRELQELIEQQGAMRITAPIGGKLTLAGNVETGSSLNKNAKVGTIADLSEFTVKLPYILEEAVQLQAGDEIDLTVEGQLLTKVGKVEAVDRVSRAGQGGAKLVDVTVKVAGDGTLDAGLAVTGSVMHGDREIKSQGSGTLEYARTVTVMSGASGTIGELKPKSGEYIQQGDLILTIANDSLQDDIAAKQADVERQAANVENLSRKLSELTVVAPFDGVFSADFADQKKNVLASYPVGVSVKAGTAFGAVASLDTMTLAVQVDELDLPSVKPGLKAQVTVDALPGRSFEGEVLQVSTVGVTTNGVTYYDVIIAVPNTEQSELKYGMTGTAEIIVEEKKNALLLPIEALQQRGGRRTVTLKKADGTLEPNHPIEIGIRSKTHVEVTEGLEEGDQVVIPTRQQSTNLNQQQADQLRRQFQGGAGGTTGGGFPGGGGIPAGGGGGFPGGGGGFQGGGGGGSR